MAALAAGTARRGRHSLFLVYYRYQAFGAPPIKTSSSVNSSRFLRDKVIEDATKGSIPYLARSVLILNGRPPMSRI